MFCLHAKRYHNKWEFWVHKALYELFQAPYFSYSQTVMAELSPPGFDFMVRIRLRQIARFRTLIDLCLSVCLSVCMTCPER